MDTDIGSPQESIAVIRQTLDRTRRHLRVPDGPIYKVWGVVVLVGHAATLILSQRWPRDVAGPLSGAVWMALAVPAGAFTVWYFRRITSPERGVSSPLAPRIWAMWTLGLAIPPLTGAVAGLPDYAIVAMGAAGVACLNIVEGLLFFNPVALGLGLWIAIVNIAGLSLGRQGFLLASAVLQGGGMIVAGLLEDRRGAGA